MPDQFGGIPVDQFGGIRVDASQPGASQAGGVPAGIPSVDQADTPDPRGNLAVGPNAPSAHYASVPLQADETPAARPAIISSKIGRPSDAQVAQMTAATDEAADPNSLSRWATTPLIDPQAVRRGVEKLAPGALLGAGMQPSSVLPTAEVLARS